MQKNIKLVLVSVPMLKSAPGEEWEAGIYALPYQAGSPIARKRCFARVETLVSRDGSIGNLLDDDGYMELKEGSIMELFQVHLIPMCEESGVEKIFLYSDPRATVDWKIEFFRLLEPLLSGFWAVSEKNLPGEGYFPVPRK